MEDIFIVSNNTALLDFGRGKKNYEDTIAGMCEHIAKVDQAPVFSELEALVYLWELKYGYAPTPTEAVSMDDFMSLAAVRLNQEGKLLFVSWDDPDLVVQAGPLTRASKFEGFQLHANN